MRTLKVKSLKGEGWRQNHSSSRSDACDQISGRRQYDNSRRRREHGLAAPGRNDDTAKGNDGTDESLVCADSARVSAAVGGGER